MSKVEVDADRQLLRESRQVRRKQKKQEKQLRKEKEKELNKLELKFGPRDSRITIVTRDFVSSISNTKTSASNVEIREDEFPVLGQTPCKLEKPKSTVEIKEEMKEENGKRAKSTIKIDIKDIIAKPEKNCQKEKEKSIAKSYEGNILDASQPDRKKGKHREILRPKRPSKLKATLLKEHDTNTEEKIYRGIHSPLFEIYCDNCVTEELNNATKKLIKEIVNFQEKLYKRDPIKGCAKRRYVLGFHEVMKFLKVDKLKLIIIAPNINFYVEDGVLDHTIKELKSFAYLYDIPYMFALSRRIIGRLCLKSVPVSCVGILDYSGAEDSFKYVTELLHVMKDQYKQILPVVANEEETIVQQLQDKLLQALK